MKKRKGGGKDRGGDAWSRAGQLCRLSARQLDMARRLGMNPDKLPGLRPSPSQRWKRPVADFIEFLYQKRFGDTFETRFEANGPGSGKSATRSLDADTAATARVEELLVFITDLADDLGAWLADETVTPAVVARLGEELHEIAQQLAANAPIHAPRRPGAAPPGGLDEEDGDAGLPSDDDIPF